MLGNPRDLRHDLGRHCRSINIQLGSLLNVIKAAVPAVRQYYTAEQVCYPGVLARVMKSHIDQTGVDPRKVSRAVVDQEGAPPILTRILIGLSIGILLASSASIQNTTEGVSFGLQLVMIFAGELKNFAPVVLSACALGADRLNYGAPGRRVHVKFGCPLDSCDMSQSRMLQPCMSHCRSG